MTHTIEAAYLSGFEPSTDTLATEEHYTEACRYLIDLTSK